MKKYLLCVTHIILFVVCSINNDFAYGYQIIPTSYIDYNEINDITFEADFVWCACNGGVVKWNVKDGSHEIYTTKDGLTYKNVWSVAVDHNGVKWFGGRSDGVVSFDGTKWTNHHNFSGRTVVDHNNVKWFFGHSMTSYDDESGKVHSPGRLGSVFAAVEDLNHVLWFAGYSLPLTSYDGTTFTYHSQYQGSSTDWEQVPDWEWILDIAVDSSNTKWLASFNGLYSFHEGLVTEYNVRDIKNADGVEANATTIDIDANDMKWFGSSDYLWSFDGESYRSFQLPEPAGIRKIRCRDDGTVWVATQTGLYSFDGDSWERYYVDGPGKFRRWLLTIDHTDIHWYIHTGAVPRFDIYHDNGRGARQTPNFGDQRSSYYNFLCTAVDTYNTKWFGTDWFGVLRYDGENAEWFTTKDGLVDKTVVCVASDDNGKMWFGTNRGVSSFDGTDWGTHTEEDGLVSNLGGDGDGYLIRWGRISLRNIGMLGPDVRV